MWNRKKERARRGISQRVINIRRRKENTYDFNCLLIELMDSYDTSFSHHSFCLQFPFNNNYLAMDCETIKWMLMIWNGEVFSFTYSKLLLIIVMIAEFIFCWQVVA